MRYKLKINNDEECYWLLDMETHAGGVEDEFEPTLVANIFRGDDAVNICKMLNNNPTDHRGK